jgi:aspartyl aminopeptidase
MPKSVGHICKNMAKKINYQKLEKELLLNKRSCWEAWDEGTKKKAFEFAEGYKEFLREVKTESEAVAEGVKILEKNGFKDISTFKKIKTGDKVYAVNRGKNLIAARIGRENMNKGFSLIMSHIDSPHLDMKVTPLYEDENLAFFKTHYYGGIKKYQWPTIALALHGTVYLLNGKKVDIKIGEDEDDPIFMITDLLPHLDRAGGPRSTIKNREVEGEDLNLVVGSVPVRDDASASSAQAIKEKVKLAILEYLNKKYSIKEEDLSSADLAAVPSEKPRDLGFDRSLISAYGQDDRICAYASIESLIKAKISNITQAIVWTDKEETGSEGNTGTQTPWMDLFFSDLLKLSDQPFGIKDVYKIYEKCQSISADVAPAVDPDYKDVHDLRNSFRLGYGLTIEKYTGSGGKYYTSEASADYIQSLRSKFTANKSIVYQIGGGMGKIDKGGGGTIAKYLANKNMDVIDMGVPLLNIHAPLEIASKGDLYSMYLGFLEFLTTDFLTF